MLAAGFLKAVVMSTCHGCYTPLHLSVEEALLALMAVEGGSEVTLLW